MKNKHDLVICHSNTASTTYVDVIGDNYFRSYGVKRQLTFSSIRRLVSLTYGKKASVGLGTHGMSVHYDMEEKQQESFPIMSISREDLDRLGFDTSKVDDATMNKLAWKVTDALGDYDLWEAVAYTGEMLDIPRPNPRDYGDDEDDFDEENEDFETKRREPDWSIGDDDDVEFDPIS